ncbi:hypothetical protein CLOM_g17054 [Closterium sp. NIES-68]|nr:hypothetical protein CLOM_g17054 [Closterium sp. NIES-68]GJP70691.1 hypothetical protein CLOP_g1603 [Closterium sp. NIES-67]
MSYTTHRRDSTTIRSLHHLTTWHSNHTHLRPRSQVDQQVLEGTDVLLGTKLAMSSAYHPQIDGQTECLNQIVEQLLRTTCKDGISKWDLHLPVLEFACNNANHAATRQTPFFLCYGRHSLMP